MGGAGQPTTDRDRQLAGSVEEEGDAALTAGGNAALSRDLDWWPAAGRVSVANEAIALNDHAAQAIHCSEIRYRFRCTVVFTYA
jgi:hypothetical protein